MTGWKSTAVLILLFGMLGVMLVDSFRPRTSSLSPESMKSITAVAENMKKVADSLEQSAKATTSLQEILSVQLQGQQNEIDQLHKNLLDRYGLDPNDPDRDYANGMLQQSDGFGGGSVPPGKVPADPDPKLQKPAGGTETKADGSTAHSADGRPGTATKPTQ